MPTYRGITIALQSQYDALTIPEAALPSAMHVPEDDLVNFASGEIPKDRFLVEESCTESGVIGTTYYLDPTSRTADVSIPIYTSSQFWIVIHSLGILKKGEPNRRYTYALIDAVDEPYAIFKYHFDPEDLGDGDALSPSLSTTALCGFPIEDQRLYLNPNNASAMSKRLSFPPKVRLVPSNPQHEPFAPIKKPDPEHEGGRLARQSAHRNRYSVARDGRRSVDAIDFVTEDDTVLERPASSQSERKRETSVNLLQSVISNAMRRKDGWRGGMRFATDKQDWARDWVSEQCGIAPDISRVPEPYGLLRKGPQ
ncbi:hypothetical protein KC332_g16906 [Hortaea werneckii]|uniref:Uncharacterized protein n=1 Tax=Hortaea werneckii EXF-2000 TaxID=1157616 RepID=A0A1Z5TFC6_HORWE|nr:hypothetical protein KC358_g17049 [Hortaea werneckii]OTA34726.1 hypothetical protein BTJ68_05325 [Hortaea werneckii EXF-2000]KAI6796196.1 hypothetical protein KC350_g16866 [Hortaea werneckii]KAI6900714.1 hypothetical protein KC348_g16735 [Hortaea werneckii]KAI6919908.1 hypothetical protein KC341_g16974 [Hortaea werneckii]